MPVIETVTAFPAGVVLLETVTSVVPLSEPEPTDVSPTLRDTDPAVPLNPPNFASIEPTSASDGRVVVNVMLVAEDLLEPT